ncbi:MAG: ThiF family adenylyltransferase, partial [Clostridium sp.]
MRIIVNGKDREGTWKTAYEVPAVSPKGEFIRILNGFQIEKDIPLKEGDILTVIPKGTMPDERELESMMAARHTPHVHERVKKAKVGIAGLGGLGSHIAVMLARTGIGRLVCVDFDEVEPSNLNRQSYFIRDLGRPKAEALAQQIGEINPFITV